MSDSAPDDAETNHVEYTITWAVTRTSYRGAPQSYVISFKNYLPTWAKANKTRIISYQLFADEVDNAVYLSANVICDRELTEPGAKKPIHTPPPEPVMHSIPAAVEESPMEPAPEYDYTYVSIEDVEVGDLVRPNRKMKSTVTEIVQDGNAWVVSFDNYDTCVYNKAQKFTKLTLKEE